MNWPQRRLDEIADVLGGGTPSRTEPKYWGGECPWITPTDLPMPGEGIAEVASSAESITEAGVKGSAATPVPPGTVLFSSRATIGKIGIARVSLTTNQGFCNLVPKPGVDSKFLAFALLHETDDIARLAGSTTFKEVTRGNLRSYRISLPAPSEQRRIVELLEQADSLRKQRAEADALAARILPALFRKTFGDPASNSRDWAREPLGNFVKVQCGYAFKSDDFTSDGILLVRIGNLVGGRTLAADGSAFLPRSFGERYDRFQIARGDLLIALSGATTGKVARYDLESPALLNQRVGRFLIGDEPASLLDYLEALFKTTYIRNLMAIEMQGGGQPNLAPCEIESFTIPRPPRDLLDTFARSASSLREHAQRQLIAKAHLHRLFQGMLHRAFTRDLTARWREAHMRELLEEMEQQAGYLNVGGAK